MKFFDLPKIKEKISNKIREFNKNIWGESPLTFYFSFQGFFNRSQYFGALMTLGSFLIFIYSFDFLPLTILGGLVVFYAGLAVTQKRCRDINMKGSLFIIIYTISYLSVRYSSYIKTHDLEKYKLLLASNSIKFLVGYLGILYMLISLFLLLMPGKKQKDINLMSPLLKHPLIYFMISVIMMSPVLYLLDKTL